jgi:hypothetical protein
MRARIKRRERNRRILIIVVVAAVIAVFAVSAYYLSLPSSLDSYDYKPVTSAHIAGLKTAAFSFGTGGADLVSEVKAGGNFTGISMISDGKPIILYVGELGCPYCAEMRWALVLALMRFGNFTNLSYMTSAYDGTDFPTFTFIGSTYTSKYITFQSFEVLDRGTNSLQTLPTNYSAIFQQYSANQGVPFIDYGGQFYSPSALLPSTLPSGYSNYVDYLSSLFGNSNWTQVISNLNNANSLVYQTSSLASIIHAGANVIATTICRLTGNLPVNVCPISQLAPVGLSPSISPAVAGVFQMVIPPRKE